MFNENVDAWHDFIEGVTYAMYSLPDEFVDDCALCDKLGRHFGGIQVAVSRLEAGRSAWVNQDAINSLGFFDKIKALLAIYVLVWSIGYNIDEIWNSNVIQDLTRKMLQKLDSEYTVEIEQNVMNNWTNLTIILIDLPGSDCEEIGARIGLTIRRLSGVSID